MDGRMQRLLFASLLPYSMALALLLHVPARASTYQALCGTTACTVNLDANGIASQGRFIPNGRVAQWFTGGQETFDTTNGTVGAIGGGTAGAIAGGVLLGPIGLVGGMVGGAFAGSRAGKSASLYFTVVGYDTAGQKTTLSFRFVNPKPANQLKTELPMFTGLAMGQVRPIAELQRTGSALKERLPERLSDLPPSLAIPSQPHAPGR